MVETTEENHISLEIQDENISLAASIIEKLNPKTSLSPCYIFKIPERLYNATKEMFDPQLVSIGPYHYGKEALTIITDHKIRFLNALISRTTTIETSLKDLIKSIRELEGQARECYEEHISLTALTTDEFVRMMVIDGCFILELFIKHWKKEKIKYTEDPVISMAYNIRHDLLLLENQLPYIVLKCLLNLTGDPAIGSVSLNELASNFFFSELDNKLTMPVDEHKHLLDLVRKRYIHSSQEIEYGDDPFWTTTHGATDLWAAGVKFKKKENSQSLVDITFSDDHGTFEMKPLIFSLRFTVELRNSIALEQCRGDYSTQVTSYVILLDNLINSKNDVKILSDIGILHYGYTEDDEKIAVRINDLVKGIIVNEFYYAGLCDRVKKYCQTDWNKWKASLKHNYFNTPWAVLSFLAAIILLLLTFTQTVFSILSYIP